MAGPAWLAAAVPVSTKIPVPMMAPMPSSVRSSPVRVRFRALAPCSASPTNCSIDFVFRRFESTRPPLAAHTSALIDALAEKRAHYTLRAMSRTALREEQELTNLLFRIGAGQQ